jgi:hypothetical protein
LVAELHALISAGSHFYLFSAGYDISLYISLSGILPSTVVTSVSVFSSLVLVSAGPVVAAQAGVSLVEDDISHVTDEVINS